MRYICTAVVATLALVGTSFAAPINVPADQPTIAAAINASSDGDTIAIAAGTYNEHSLNTGGKAITIGSASGNLDVTIDANGGGSVFVFNSGEGNGTVIKDLVITGGSGGLVAGGIFCEHASPTISGCTISGNTSDYGGGIACNYYSNPTISDCTIEDNTAYYGGGIYCEYSNPTITGCTFTSNMPDTIFGDIILGGSPSTTGACCVSSGCHALTEDACAGMGGTWLGEGGSCDDCPASCTGDLDNNGIVDMDDLLGVIGAWGVCP